MIIDKKSWHYRIANYHNTKHETKLLDNRGFWGYLNSVIGKLLIFVIIISILVALCWGLGHDLATSYELEHYILKEIIYGALAFILGGFYALICMFVLFKVIIKLIEFNKFIKKHVHFTKHRIIFRGVAKIIKAITPSIEIK